MGLYRPASIRKGVETLPADAARPPDQRREGEVTAADGAKDSK